MTVSTWFPLDGLEEAHFVFVCDLWTTTKLATHGVGPLEPSTGSKMSSCTCFLSSRATRSCRWTATGRWAWHTARTLGSMSSLISTSLSHLSLPLKALGKRRSSSSVDSTGAMLTRAMTSEWALWSAGTEIMRRSIAVW